MKKAIASAKKVRAIGNQARDNFIDREEMITAMERAMVSGEHLMVLGPPGTAKSAMIRFFAAAAGLSFFRRLLNPDTTREDLVGPIDPSALKEGRWDRCWAGLATADMALLDEIGKASSQVVNMLLDALEERKVTSGNLDKDIPLHLAMAASNETLSDEAEAMWDRFSIRLVVSFITDPNDFVRLLQDTHKKAKEQAISGEELRMMRQACLEMAQSPSQAVVGKLLEMWTNIANVSTERVSDRRWKRVLVVAAANALLQGQDDMEVSDLMAARDMLWSRVDERRQIQEWVSDLVDEEQAALKATRMLIEDLIGTSAGVSTLEDKARVTYRAAKLKRDIASYRGSPWDAARDELDAVIASMTDENGES